ncbi:MAG: c-type cytochrome [Pseudomonadota bacterium]
MKNFALLIAGLAVFTVITILASIQLNKLTNRPDNPDKLAALEARIAPIGGVYAGETGAAALAAAEAAAAADVPQLAFDGSLDGGMIYDNVCAACHTAGVAGSPQLVRSVWDERLAQGMDTLVEHAINGYQGSAGLMPARGGRMDLSDEQVQIAVQWMVDNLQ